MGSVGRCCLEREVGLLQTAQALDARRELHGEGDSELLARVRARARAWARIGVRARVGARVRVRVKG